MSAADVWSRGWNDAKSVPDSVLFARIAETVAWCSRLAGEPNFRPALRTPELIPRLLHEGRDDVICDLGHWRRNWVRDEVADSIHSFPDLCGGALLVYFPDADLCDGAAAQESDGFFDDFNTPPWDTWVAYFEDDRPEPRSYRSYLVSYVPAELLGAAHRGVYVNPEECIQWLLEADVELRNRLSAVLKSQQ